MERVRVGLHSDDLLLVLNMPSKICASVLVMVVVVAATAALSRPDSGYGAPQAPAQYDFQYSVQDVDSGNDYGQKETRNDDNIQGSYQVQLPDGRLQRVAYRVEGDSGYVAEVSFEGEAQYRPQQADTYA